MRQNPELLMGSRRFYRAPELQTEFRMNPSARSKPLREVVLYCLGRDVQKVDIAKYRPEELQCVHVLLMVARTPEWRLGTTFQEPIRPLPQGQLLAVEHGGKTALVPRVQAAP